MTLELQDRIAGYRSLLLDDILPWWEHHAIDGEHGGLLSCIGDDGVVLNHDKYIWSQVRALWTFAAAYRRMGRDPGVLELADHMFTFVRDHGRDGQGDWVFRVSRDGSVVLDGPDSIQSDAFAICALTEYALATGRDEPLAMAYESYRRSREKLAEPGSYQTRPYPIPEGMKAQRVSMQFSLAYHDLAKATGDEAVRRQAMELTDDVLDHYRRPELAATLEYLHVDNSVPSAPYGTYVSPGHGIETAWFQIENLRPAPDADRLAKCVDILRWSLRRGWDQEHGGLFYAMDTEGAQPLLPHADAKLWWPHCEALCGTALAYEFDPDAAWLEWHDRIYAWSIEHFPVKPGGEWTQRLDRTGTRRLDDVVALPVKDPFHLPRGLIYAIESLERAVAHPNSAPAGLVSNR